MNLLWAQTACTADRLLKFRKTVVLSYRPGGMRVYGQAQALTDFPVPLIPGPHLAEANEPDLLVAMLSRLEG